MSLLSGNARFIDVSPVSLSYVAALRGVTPRVPETPFTYAELRCHDVHKLICLAACNPEGQFFGIVNNVAEAAKAEAIARARRVRNISFLAELAFLQLAPTDPLVPPLDYLILDETEVPLSSEERSTLLAIAEKMVRPGGLFAYSYNAYDTPEEIPSFLVDEFAPEMNPAQAKEFLHEIKALGWLYFKNNPSTHAALEKAIAEDNPEIFFTVCKQEAPPRSGTIDTMENLLTRGFSLAGSAIIGANYLEMSTPACAHAVLEKCREHVLYEPLKDFAINRTVRHDVWCRLPAEQTNDPSLLFGKFTFGIASLRDGLPSTIEAQGKTLDLRTPLLAKMIGVMNLLPMSIGDFLQHPAGKDASPDDVLAAMQVLVAANVVRPMRSHYQSKPNAQLDQMKWATDFNRYLDDTPITDAHVLLASQVVGNGVIVSARDALVMQAINRAGMVHSPDALLLELMRVANNPALAAKIMDTADPTPESAHNMVNAVLDQSMVHWCAYGLLAA